MNSFLTLDCRASGRAGQSNQSYDGPEVLSQSIKKQSFGFIPIIHSFSQKDAISYSIALAAHVPLRSTPHPALETAVGVALTFDLVRVD